MGQFRIGLTVPAFDESETGGPFGLDRYLLTGFIVR